MQRIYWRNTDCFIPKSLVNVLNGRKIWQRGLKKIKPNQKRPLCCIFYDLPVIYCCVVIIFMCMCLMQIILLEKIKFCLK